MLTGVRRCGKSVLLNQIEDELRSSGYDEEHVIKVNFEDLQFEKIRNAERLNKYVTDHIKDDERYLIFLDEIQHVRSFEKVLSSLRATVNCSIFITGSKQYFISFSNERLQTSWIRFTNEEVNDMISKKREFVDVISEAKTRGDVVIFAPSIENVDLQEIKYFRFPNYNGERFSINQVADASLPDQKRLRCNLFIGEADEKEEIIKKIWEGIDWLKGFRNVDSPTLHHKNGDMEADALYINVFRCDARKNKDLFPNNKNFVCFVDYNASGNTTLKCGGLPLKIWQKFYHEKIGKLDIAWRESKYAIRNVKKINVNDPCPCGSGKKFKKCCRGKGIYD